MHVHPLKICALALVATFIASSSASAEDAVASATATATASATAAAPSDKWRIDCSGGTSTGEGDVQFRVTPKDGAAILVTAKISRGRGEMHIAKDMLAAFKTALPVERFRGDIFHGQQILLKSRGAEPAFVVELVDATVPGIRFKVAPG